jgi:hypothetical protein
LFIFIYSTKAKREVGYPITAIVDSDNKLAAVPLLTSSTFRGRSLRPSTAWFRMMTSALQLFFYKPLGQGMCLPKDAPFMDLVHAIVWWLAESQGRLTKRRNDFAYNARSTVGIRPGEEYMVSAMRVFKTVRIKANDREDMHQLKSDDPTHCASSRQHTSTTRRRH